MRSGIAAKRNAVIRFWEGGGGGWQDPRTRPAEWVLEDVIDEARQHRSGPRPLRRRRARRRRGRGALRDRRGGDGPTQGRRLGSRRAVGSPLVRTGRSAAASLASSKWRPDRASRPPAGRRARLRAWSTRDGRSGRWVGVGENGPAPLHPRRDRSIGSSAWGHPGVVGTGDRVDALEAPARTPRGATGEGSALVHRRHPGSARRRCAPTMSTVFTCGGNSCPGPREAVGSASREVRRIAAGPVVSVAAAGDERRHPLHEVRECDASRLKVLRQRELARPRRRAPRAGRSRLERRRASSRRSHVFAEALPDDPDPAAPARSSRRLVHRARRSPPRHVALPGSAPCRPRSPGEEGGVLDRPGDRAGVVDRLVDADDPGVRDEPVCRLQPDDAAPGGRDADRAALIAADPQVDAVVPERGGEPPEEPPASASGRRDRASAP